MSPRLFLNRYGLATIACIAAQQVMVASATYLLIHLMINFQEGRNITPWLLAYCAAMLLPYLPGCLGQITLQAWVNACHRHYVTLSTELIRQNKQIHISPHAQSSLETRISKQSFNLISEFLHFVHSFTDCFLSSLLNVFVLAWLLPGDLAIGYIISSIISLVIVATVQKRIGQLSNTMERQHVRYSSHLQKIWDNVFLGNQYNDRLWEAQRAREGESYYRQALALHATSSLTQLGLACATLLPTIYLICAAFLTESAQAPLLAALIANLTRIFHVLSGVTHFVSQLIACRSIWARVGVLFELKEEDEPHPTPAARPLDLGVRVPALKLNGVDITSVETTLKQLAEESSGRFTLTGENGSGKSTLMLHLKRLLGVHAYYLPARPDGLTWEADIHGLSTGQKMRTCMNELATVDGLTHLLLDEWDANLDQTNRTLLDAIIAKRAQHMTIIEIRHGLPG